MLIKEMALDNREAESVILYNLSVTLLSKKTKAEAAA